MLTNTNTNIGIQEIVVSDLFNDETKKYCIPIYQRDYAWEKPEIEQLLNDVFSYLEDGFNENYYIGSLIVSSKNDNEFEIIDGQQRLTTFYILFKYINKYFPIEIKSELTFESREKSSFTLKQMNVESFKIDKHKFNLHIVKGYEIIKNYFEREEHTISKLIEYLKNVIIMQIEVPKGTDLNHYFEIMNNRGEQLTEVELIRADFYSKIYKNNQEQAKIFKNIWDSIASMDNYFEVEYADWKKAYSEFEPHKIESETGNFVEQFNESKEFTLENILKSQNNIKLDSTKKLIRYNGILHFENFLLMVYSSLHPESLSLDKKKLLDTLYSSKLDYEFILKFIKQMIKYRIIFDRYIIKRLVDEDAEKNEWDIRIPVVSDSNYYVQSFGNSSKIDFIDEEIETTEMQTKIKLLQSMFQVTFPDQNTKYWLYGFMKFLDTNANEFVLEGDSSFILKSSSSFFNYLTNLADFYVYKYYLDRENDGKLKIKEIAHIQSFIGYEFQIIKTNDEYFNFKNETYNIGTGVPNFLFNYIEYKIYEDMFFREEKVLNLYDKIDKNKLKEYHYQYNNSVEHLYAQNQKLDDGKIDYIDNLGNLCLLTTSLNSTLSNATVKNKFQYMITNGLKNSLKMHVMYATTLFHEKNTLDWDGVLVKRHFQDIMNLMKSDWVK